MNKVEAKLRAKIANLEWEKARDGRYFWVVCEALEINHDSSITDILTAIERIKEQ